MNSKTKIAIGLLAAGTVLYIITRNEKPLTPEQIAAGENFVFKDASKILMLVGGGMLIYQTVIKKN